MSGADDTGAAPAAPGRRRLTTYLRYHVEPHHVRATQRRELAAMLRVALDPLPVSSATILVMDLAADVLNRGLDAAIARFVDAALPALSPPEDTS